MSYGDTWNSSAFLIARQQWVSLENLEELIDSLEETPFSLQAGRTEALAAIGKLTYTTNVASKSKRFPDDVAFVHRNGKDWPQKFTQVITALNYKPPENSFIVGNDGSSRPERPKARADDASLIAEPTERQKFEKALLSFEQGLASMRTQLGTMTGVYDRDKFEREFYLKWA